MVELHLLLTIITTYIPSIFHPSIQFPLTCHGTVIMWHFGQDSLTGYIGEKFEIQWKDGLQVFHIYSKQSIVIKNLKENNNLKRNSRIS